MADRLIKEVAGVEIAIPVKFIGSAVVIVGARLKDDVGDRTASAAKLCFKVAGGNVNGLNGFEGRNDNLQEASTFVVVNSFNLIVVALTELAIDFRLQRAACVEKLRVLKRGARCARD